VELTSVIQSSAARPNHADKTISKEIHAANSSMDSSKILDFLVDSRASSINVMMQQPIATIRCGEHINTLAG
jgi:hypothetical protein